MLVKTAECCVSEIQDFSSGFVYTPEIKNLIFDLGGVILNLDTSKTHDAFGKLGGITAAQIKEALTTSAFCNDYEKGLMTDDEFRAHIRTIITTPVSDLQIDEAWNAMLLSIPMERLEFLEKLGEKHALFLLSNTNNIHLQFFNQIVRTVSGHYTMDPYFQRTYFSHILKMRKPDVEIYEHLLKENNLVASETLFLDDNLENLHGAEKAGIRTAHVEYPDMIFSILA